MTQARTPLFAIALALFLALPAPRAHAQDAPPQTTETDEGLSLLEQGAQMLLRGLAQEMGPALDDLREGAQELEPVLRDLVQNMGPALRDLLDKAGDLSAFEPPEVLPNGDILLRRKPAPRDPAVPAQPAPEGSVDL